MRTWFSRAFWLEPNPLTDIWRSFQLIANHDDLLKISIGILGTAALLALFWRRQRRHVRTALVMYTLAFFLMVVSAVPAAFGWESATKTLHAIGLLLVGF